MKIEDFAAWKERFIKDVDMETGTKTSYQLEDFHANWIDNIRFMDSIEGIEYFIGYQSGPKSYSIITFDTLDEFDEAQSYSAENTWDVDKMLNEYIDDLGVVFPNTPENIEKFNKRGDVNIKKGANGARKSPTKDELRDYTLKHCGDRLPVVVHEDGEVEVFENGKWIKNSN